MYRFWLILLAFATLSCGSGGGRQLQSISVASTVNGNEIQFVAMGTFSSAPVKATPLPVAWTNGLMAPPPKTFDYTLTTKPYVFNCPGSQMIQVEAFAPPNPDAPMSGSASKVVQGSAAANCP